MINQLFKRLPTDDEFNIILKCYGIDDITNNIRITYLSMKIHNTIENLYINLDILILKTYYLKRSKNNRD